MELVVVVVVVELGCGWWEHAREQGPGRVDEAGAGRPLMTTWYEYELRSLKFRTKMKTKMTQKMTIFAKSIFQKMIIFEPFSISFFNLKNESKNESENELKMAQK